MLKDELWRQAGYGPLDLVCPSCLEKKVGRPLVLQDFERWNPYRSTPVRWFRSLRGVNEFLAKVVGRAGKRLVCADRIVAWSHASRFRLGRKLVEPYAGRRLLDYGCGDGTLLALVHDLFPEAVGADVDPDQIKNCAKRLTDMAGVSFVLTDELTEVRHEGAYGLVVCMDVVEHCPEESWDLILSQFGRLAAPGGIIIISSPVETGPSLMGKQFIRAVAGWGGLGDYKHRETYTMAEFWKMVFAGEQTTIDRPVYRADFASEKWKHFHGHKGFNWRKLRARVDERLAIQRTCFSPLGWMGEYFSSQVWFICRRR
jgi:2-polyprenyl-3-methyl-5-hydroxy-6-metoxy-1,4-benzoquinol methylase